MGLSQALSAAVSGMRVTQAGLSLVAANIANAETPGYVRKTATQVATASGGLGIGVRFSAVNRELDIYVQRQLRLESSGAAYANLRAEFYQRLQQIYGQPGADGALESVFNDFTNAIQSLVTTPESGSARYAVLTAAQVMAQHLNGMTADIQSLRTDAEGGITAAIAQANNAMQQIARINQQLGTSVAQDGTMAVLLDQRDAYIDQLSQLMDVRIVEGDHNQIGVFTLSGTQLVGTEAAVLRFDAKGVLTPGALWSADPNQRGVGTIVLTSPNGPDIDLIANGTFRSGEIAAYIEMRDQVLVEAQAQLDQIAAGLARALSDRTTQGTAVTAGAQTGFTADIGSLLNGNTISLTYTDTLTNTQRKVTIVRVDDPGALPLKASATADPNDQVIGVNFSGGIASVVAQLNSALGTTGLQFANPSGTTLQVLDDGASGAVDVNALSTTVTVTSLTGGSGELPFFMDGTNPYSGQITASGTQSLGFAGRIVLNPALLADPTKLVAYEAGTATGDPLRPAFLLDRLTSGALDFAPQAGIGTTAAPFSGTLGSYIRQMMSQQGEAANAAASLQQGQQIVVNTLRERFSEQSSVNIDQEMATLLNLQMAYGANARVMTTVRDMLDLLMRM